MLFYQNSEYDLDIYDVLPIIVRSAVQLQDLKGNCFHTNVHNTKSPIL